MINSNPTKKIAFSLTLIGAIVFASTAFADSGASDYESAQQINAANELLRKGEIDQAIEGYSNVANSEANRDELKYNMAVAQYRKSDIPAATSLFNETAGSADASIAARSRFNLGNCLYANALQTAEQDKPAAIEQLRTAISHFRGSLRSMPDNEDARANIELAAELIRKLEDEQKQEEQQQQQDQDQQDQQQQNQDQQNQDQDQQNQDSQDSQSQDSKSDQSQQDNQQKEQSEESKSEESNSDQSKSDESKPDESNSDQSKSDESKADEQNKNESEQNDSENKSDESQQQQSQDSAQQQQPEQPSPSQPNAEQNQAEKQPPNKQSRSNVQQSKEVEASLDEQPQDNQPVPTGELTAADQQDDNKEPNGSVAMTDPNAKDDGLMTKEEALKMLQAVRDRDMLRRLRQQQRERSRNIPVDRNW